MTELKSNKELLKKIGKAAKRKISEKEKQQQRISFIYAGVSRHSDISKIDIEKSLKKAS